MIAIHARADIHHGRALKAAKEAEPGVIERKPTALETGDITEA